MVFFLNVLTTDIYEEFENVINSDAVGLNGTEVSDTLATLVQVEQTVWDYAILGVILGIVLNLILFSFATRISPVFYWLFAMLSLLTLFIGSIMSNIWQEMVSQPSFAADIARFPISNAILGNSSVLFITTIVITIGIIITFGKAPGGEPGLEIR